MGVAAALGSATRAVDVFSKEVQRIDDLRVSEAELAYRQRVRSAFEDPRDGFMAKKGTDAIEGLDGFRGRLSSAASEIEANLTSETQRMLFRRRAAQLQADADAQAGRYVRQETERVQAETFTALNEADMQAIADNPMNADSLIAAMDERTAIFGDDMGRASVVIVQDRAKVRSAARLAQVEALATRDPEMASKVLTDHLTEIAPRERGKARLFVENATMDVRSQQARDELLVEFPDDERAALQAARDRYTGKMEDEVTRRVRAVFAQNRETVTARGNDLLEQAIQAAGTNGNIDAVPLAIRTQLQTQYPSKYRAFTTYARDLQNGTIPVSSLDTIEELNDKTPDEWLKVDLNEYRGRLSYEDFRTYSNYQRGIRNPNSGTGRAGMTPPEIDRFLWDQSKAMGIIPSGVNTMAQLRNYKSDADGYTQLRTAIYDRIKAAAEKGPLTAQEQEDIITATLDDRVLRTSGTNRPLPRAAILPNQSARDLTPRDSARFNITPRVDLRAPLSPRAQTRAIELKNQGYSLEEAQAVLQQEGLLNPTP